ATEPAPQALRDRFSVICQTLSNYQRQPVWDIEASFKKASALRLRFSQSLARRRQRLSHAIVRSTIQRLGSCTNPFACSDRLTISVLRPGRILASALPKIGP